MIRFFPDVVVRYAGNLASGLISSNACSGGSFQLAVDRTINKPILPQDRVRPPAGAGTIMILQHGPNYSLRTLREGSSGPVQGISRLSRTNGGHRDAMRTLFPDRKFELTGSSTDGHAM